MNYFRKIDTRLDKRCQYKIKDRLQFNFFFKRIFLQIPFTPENFLFFEGLKITLALFHHRLTQLANFTFGAKVVIEKSTEIPTVVKRMIFHIPEFIPNFPFVMFVRNTRIVAGVKGRRKCRIAVVLKPVVVVFGMKFVMEVVRFLFKSSLGWKGEMNLSKPEMKTVRFFPW